MTGKGSRHHVNCANQIPGPRIVQTTSCASCCTVGHVCDDQECSACQSCLLTAAGPLAKAPVRRAISPDLVDPITAASQALASSPPKIFAVQHFPANEALVIVTCWSDVLPHLKS